jgi:hypothetical protein
MLNWVPPSELLSVRLESSTAAAAVPARAPHAKTATNADSHIRPVVRNDVFCATDFIIGDVMTGLLACWIEWLGLKNRVAAFLSIRVRARAKNEVA